MGDNGKIKKVKIIKRKKGKQDKNSRPASLSCTNICERMMVDLTILVALRQNVLKLANEIFSYIFLTLDNEGINC